MAVAEQAVADVARANGRSGSSAELEESFQAEMRERALINELFDVIQAEAYKLWQERGCPHGSDLDDWFTAQERVLAQQPRA